VFRSIPNITRHLLIINFLAFFASWVLEMRGINLAIWCGLHYFESPYFQIYQIITYQFMHGSFTHLFFNMFALWMFGCSIEQEWGSKKYLFYYLACGIGAGLCQELVQFFMGSYSLTIGASGAVYGILLAFGMIFPRRIIGIPLAIVGLVVLDLVNTSVLIQNILSLLNQLFFFALVIAMFNPANGFSQRIWRLLYTKPVEARWCVSGYIAIEFLYLLKNVPGDTVAHMAHIGGMVVGFLIIYYWKQKEKQAPFTQFRRNTNQTKWQQTTSQRTNSKEADMEYNIRKRQNQERVDAILDKIRKSGYESLTKEEKQFLFDASHEK